MSEIRKQGDTKAAEAVTAYLTGTASQRERDLLAEIDRLRALLTDLFKHGSLGSRYPEIIAEMRRGDA